MSDNIDNDFVQHGGNLSYIKHNFPNAPQPFIDLSTGINPYSYPFKQTGENHRLADTEEMAVAIRAAADYYGVLPKKLTIGAGMQPLLFALAGLRFQKFGMSRVAILSPTYSEYKIIWQAAGHEVVEVSNIEKLAGADVAIICNPNNPDGKIYSPEKLEKLQNNWLIIDEAFADLLPRPNPLPEGEGVIRMRSCGKFFGIAGFRVSSAIASTEITAWLRLIIGAWPIATDACLMLPAMLKDKVWIEQNKVRLERESRDFRDVLSNHFEIIGYTSLFTLVETDDADYWHSKLAKQGILVRKFSYNKNWLRLGLPKAAYKKRIESALND